MSGIWRRTLIFWQAVNTRRSTQAVDSHMREHKAAYVREWFATLLRAEASDRSVYCGVSQPHYFLQPRR